MKKILLLLFISFVSISSYSQGNGYVLKVIYGGCGYTIGVAKYKDGHSKFSIDLDETVYLNGFHVNTGSAKDIYSDIKAFCNFVEENGNTDGYTEEFEKYNLMIVRGGFMMPNFLVIIKDGKDRRVDFNCIKDGKKKFEKYCMKNKIQLE